MTGYDYAADMAEQSLLTKKRNKKKLNDLLDKYGSKEGIEQNATPKDSFEYMFANGDELIDEVLEERQKNQQQSDSLQTLYHLEKRETQDDILSTNIPKIKDKKSNKDSKEKDTPVDLYLNDSFFDKLGMLESSNDYTKSLNGEGIGAIGKYQIRGLGLIDLGYLDNNYQWTGKNGIYNINDFKKNKDLQEQIVRELSNLNYKYLKNNGSLNYLGREINGKVDDFKITVAGLLAAAHKEGAGGVNKYLRKLEKNEKGDYYLPYQKYKGDTLRSLLAVETRLREFEKLGKN